MRLSGVRVGTLAALMLYTPPIIGHPGTGRLAQQMQLPASTRDAAATVDSFHAALRRGDTASAAAHLADDALIFEEGGAERTKAEYQARHLAADAAFSQAVSSIVTRRSGHLSGLLVWIATEGRTSGEFKGKLVDRTTTETMILRRVNRGWKIIHIHWSSAAAH